MRSTEPAEVEVLGGGGGDEALRNGGKLMKVVLYINFIFVGVLFPSVEIIMMISNVVKSCKLTEVVLVINLIYFYQCLIYFYQCLVCVFPFQVA